LQKHFGRPLEEFMKPSSMVYNKQRSEKYISENTQFNWKNRKTKTTQCNSAKNKINYDQTTKTRFINVSKSNL
jgi:hypothetical protein